MKKLLALLLTVCVLALPLCSFAEDSALTELAGHPVFSALLNKLMSGGSLETSTTFSMNGAEEALGEIPGASTALPLVNDLFEALSINQTISMQPFQARMGIALNDAEVISFTAEAGEDMLYAASTLLGKSVIALTGEDITSLLKEAGLDLEEIVEKLQQIVASLQELKFENMGAYIQNNPPQVQPVELTQPDDADPAAVKVQIVFADDFFAGLADAIAADIEANAEVLNALEITVTEENIASMKENLGKLKVESMFVYLGEENDLVAFEAVLTDGEDPVSISAGIKSSDSAISVTSRVSDSETTAVTRYDIEVTLEENKISCAVYMNSDITTGDPAQTVSSTIVNTSVMALDENGEVYGSSHVVISSSSLPGFSFGMTETFMTAGPVESIATEDAVRIATMDAQDRTTWLQSTVMPNLMVVLGNVLQNAPESISSLVMQMMGMDAPTAQ